MIFKDRFMVIKLINLKNILLKHKYNISLLIIWLFITLITLLNHEIWRDEAQVWCIVRDLNIIDIFKTARIEGHPMLWYLIVMPFAKLGFPVISMQMLSLLLVFAAVVFLIFRSPFNNFFKTIVVFSSGMLYFIPVVARNYALIPIFIFILADLYKKRTERPFLYIFILILLSHTHILMLCFCLVLFIFFAVEKIIEYIKNKNIRLLYPVLILFLNFLLLFFVFNNTSRENFVVAGYGLKGFTLLEILQDFSSIYFSPLFNNFPGINFFIFYSCIGLILYSFSKYDKKCAILLLTSLIYFIFVYSKVWFGGVPYQKGFVLYLILLFCFWIIKTKTNTDRQSDIYISILFIISLLLAPVVILGDINYNFSGGKQTAEFIRKNLNNENTFIVIGYPYTYSPISAYLPDKKLYYYHQNYYISYFNFSADNKYIKSEFPDNAIYYIVQDDFVLNENMGFRLLFVSDKENISSGKEKEIFSIYIRE